VNPGDALWVGDKLHGLCGGAFGSDSYGEKTVEAIGRDWVVVREGGRILLFVGNPEGLCEYRTEEVDPEIREQFRRA